MEIATRVGLMNWLVSQGLTGLPENDLIRGFCERCCAAGLDLSRSLVFIDTLHPIFEGRGFRWNDSETNEPDSFEYGPTGDNDDGWRRSVFYHMLEGGHDELQLDLADPDVHRFSRVTELVEKGHRHMLGFVHRFGETGALGQMDCFYSYWLTRRDTGFHDRELDALRDLIPVLGMVVKSAQQVDIVRTLGRVYLGRDASERVLHGKISRGVTERINAVLWFSDLRGSTSITESIAPDEIIPFLNDYAQAAIDAIHDSGGDVLEADRRRRACDVHQRTSEPRQAGGAARRASVSPQHDRAQREPRRRGQGGDVSLCRPACRRGVLRQHRP